MDKKEMKIYTSEEVCEYLNKPGLKKTEQAKFLREGFRCFGAGERGMGGLSRTAKFIPESIHIIVSPVACQRHCDFDLKINGYTDGVYSIFLSEQEIVGGKVVEVLKKEILNLLQTLSPQPKVITITVTCIDGLIRSDYAGLEQMLMKEYGIRFGVVEMFPILADNKIKHTDQFPHMVYGRIKADPEKPKKKLINLIGKIDLVDPTTDFYTVLGKAGYEVREIRQCQTLEEFDEMGEACLNVVLSYFNLHAAKMMETKYKIPYFFWNQHMDFETIRSNYEELERILECSLSIEPYYQQAKEKAEEARRLAKGKTFAVSQRLDYIPVKAACDLAAVGFDIVSVFVDKIDRKDLKYYEWMKENSPHTKIYLAPDISMRTYMQSPESVDFAVGGIPALKNVENLRTLNLPEEPYDFTTYCRVMDKLIEQLKCEEKRDVPDIISAEESVFARQWKDYPKGVV